MPRFVVLEHRWCGVHWDLMLEFGAALRTWAIDAPIVPEADLPARALPDHRPLYLDYEGPVSGDRGTVRRLDRGDYEVRAWSDELIRVRLIGTQLSGEAELRRSGAPNSEALRAGGWTFRLGKVD